MPLLCDTVTMADGQMADGQMADGQIIRERAVVDYSRIITITL